LEAEKGILTARDRTRYELHRSTRAKSVRFVRYLSDPQAQNRRLLSARSSRREPQADLRCRSAYRGIAGKLTAPETNHGRQYPTRRGRPAPSFSLDFGAPPSGTHRLPAPHKSGGRHVAHPVSASNAASLREMTAQMRSADRIAPRDAAARSLHRPAIPRSQTLLTAGPCSIRSASLPPTALTRCVALGGYWSGLRRPLRSGSKRHPLRSSPAPPPTMASSDRQPAPHDRPQKGNDR
jgi:hypothetical protein